MKMRKRWTRWGGGIHGFWDPPMVRNGRLYFHFVCQSTPRGCTPARSMFGVMGTQARSRLGGYPGQVQTGGYPHPALDGGCPGQVHPSGPGPWMGYPPPHRLGQQKEYSLRGGRYASCVHFPVYKWRYIFEVGLSAAIKVL